MRTNLVLRLLCARCKKPLELDARSATAAEAAAPVDDAPSGACAHDLAALVKPCATCIRAVEDGVQDAAQTIADAVARLRGSDVEEPAP